MPAGIQCLISVVHKMLYYLQGTLVECSPQHAVVEAMGLGFYIFVPASFYFQMPNPGSTIKIYTSLQIKDDEPVLYGFPGKKERDFFKMLTGVSGIGPKAALSLLGHLSLAQLSRAILLEDFAALTCIPGIGSKTAKRLVYELKDKVSRSQAQAAEPASPAAGEERSENYWDDVQQALLSLGYSHREIAAAQKSIDNEKYSNLEELFKQVLAFLAKK
jgi:Holliday junction DNA helicase RuvA